MISGEMKMGKKLVVCMFVLLFIAGCNKDFFDTHKYAELNYSPELAIPLGNATYHINDLLVKLDSNLEVSKRNDGVAVIIYQDSLSPTYLADQVVLESQQYNSTLDLGLTSPLNLKVGDFTVSALDSNNFQFNVSHNERIDSIYLKSTQIRVTVTSHVPGNIDFHIKFKSILDSQGNPVVLDFPLDYQGSLPFTAVNTFGTDGLKLDLTANGTSHNIFTLEANMKVYSTGTTFEPGELVDYTVEVLDPKFRSAYGYLGNYNIQLSEIDTDLNLFNFDIQGSVNFESPEILLKLYNSAGLSAHLNFDSFNFLSGNSEVIPLTGTLVDSGVTVLQPSLSEMGQYMMSKITLDNTNSDLFNIIKKNPVHLTINSSIQTNPQKDTLQLNFISDTSSIVPVIVAQLPLSLNIMDLVGSQSYKLDSIDLNPDKFRDVKIKIKVENGIPLGGKLSLKFINGTDKDSLDLFKGFLELVNPAETNTDGFPVQSTIDSTYINITNDDLTRIVKSQYLNVSIILNTSDSNTGKWSKITADENLGIEVGLVGVLNQKVNLHK